MLLPKWYYFSSVFSWFTVGENPVEKGTGAELIVEWEKMSKSKYNGVDPMVRVLVTKVIWIV